MNRLRVGRGRRRTAAVVLSIAAGLVLVSTLVTIGALPRMALDTGSEDLELQAELGYLADRVGDTAARVVNPKTLVHDATELSQLRRDRDRLAELRSLLVDGSGGRSVARDVPLLYNGPGGIAARITRLLASTDEVIRLATMSDPAVLAAQRQVTVQAGPFITLSRSAFGELVKVNVRRLEVVVVRWVVLLSAGFSAIAIAGLILVRRRESIAGERAESELLGAVFERGSNPMLITDCDGIIVSANRSLSAALGWDPAEFVGRSVDDLLVPCDQRNIGDLFGQLAPLSLESAEGRQFATRSGALRSMTGTITRLNRRSGQDRLLVVLVDVTDLSERIEQLAASRAQIESLLAGLPDPAALVDEDLNFVMVHAGVEFSWFRTVPMVGQAAPSVWGSRLTAEVLDARKWARETQRPKSLTWTLIDSDGSTRTIEVRVIATGTDSLVICRDVTEAQIVEQRLTDLAEDNARLAEVLSASSDLVVITDVSGEVIYVNQAAELVRRKCETFLDMLVPESRVAYSYDALPSAQAFGSWSGELTYGDDEFELHVSQLIVVGRDSHGWETWVAHVARDISDLKAAEARLEYLATHDSLTGLPNRRLFMERIEQSLNHDSNRTTSHALIFVDLDGFKTVNDTLGHEAGDAVLTAAASRIVASVRSVDTVARIGGDEFVVLVENLPLASDAVSAAARIVASLSEPMDHVGAGVRIGASVGIAFTSPGATAQGLLAGADSAMYEAKRAGKGRFHVFGDLLPGGEFGTSVMNATDTTAAERREQHDRRI